MKTEKDTTEKLNGRIIIDSYYALKRANAFFKFLHQVVVNGIADDCGVEVLDGLITGMLPYQQLNRS